jgi:hypothetical protein
MRLEHCQDTPEIISNVPISTYSFQGIDFFIDIEGNLCINDCRLKCRKHLLDQIEAKDLTVARIITVIPGDKLDTKDADKPNPILDSKDTDEPNTLVDSKDADEPNPILNSKDIDEPSPLLDSKDADKLNPLLDSKDADEPSPLLDSKDVDESNQFLETKDIDEPNPLLETKDIDEPLLYRVIISYGLNLIMGVDVYSKRMESTYIAEDLPIPYHRGVGKYVVHRYQLYFLSLRYRAWIHSVDNLLMNQFDATKMKMVSNDVNATFPFFSRIYSETGHRMVIVDDMMFMAGSRTMTAWSIVEKDKSLTKAHVVWKYKYGLCRVLSIAVDRCSVSLLVNSKQPTNWNSNSMIYRFDVSNTLPLDNDSPPCIRKRKATSSLSTTAKKRA